MFNKFFKKTIPTIQWSTRNFTMYDKIISSTKQQIPAWYKRTPAYLGPNPPKNLQDNSTLGLYKICMPFTDTMTFGYQLLLPVDIAFSTSTKEGPLFTWRAGGQNVVKMRPDVFTKDIPVPAGHRPNQYLWEMFASVKVPKGYVFLLTNPLNRFDLPFTTMSGIVEGGYTMGEGGGVPFYIKQGFEGIIPQGTPIAQIIPFKLESWNSLRNEELNAEGKLNELKSQSVASEWYRRTHWNKKYFN